MGRPGASAGKALSGVGTVRDDHDLEQERIEAPEEAGTAAVRPREDDGVTWLRSPRERLRVLLALVAAPSVGVGLGLILQPPSLLAFMGFAPVSEPFFPAQGGVFHLVVAVGYTLAAFRPGRHRSLVDFALVVKVLATVFLLLYWLMIARVWAVLASGLSDGIMALLIWSALTSWRRAEREGGA